MPGESDSTRPRSDRNRLRCDVVTLPLCGCQNTPVQKATHIEAHDTFDEFALTESPNASLDVPRIEAVPWSLSRQPTASATAPMKGYAAIAIPQ